MPWVMSARCGRDRSQELPGSLGTCRRDDVSTGLEICKEMARVRGVGLRKVVGKERSVCVGP